MSWSARSVNPLLAWGMVVPRCCPVLRREGTTHWACSPGQTTHHAYSFARASQHTPAWGRRCRGAPQPTRATRAAAAGQAARRHRWTLSVGSSLCICDSEMCDGCMCAGAPGQGNLPADLASFQPTIIGHAIEVRICAEDPAHNYRPCTGGAGMFSRAFTMSSPMPAPHVLTDPRASNPTPAPHALD